MPCSPQSHTAKALRDCQYWCDGDVLPLSDPNTHETTVCVCVWSPGSGGRFKDGEHGFTVGRFEAVRTAADGSSAAVGGGAYLTIWRKEGDEWKVILETAVPDTPAP